MNRIAMEGGFHNVKNSLVDGTNEGEACPKRWIAALVHINCEKKVAAKLDKIGIANFVPVQQEEHQWSDRKKKIDRVVIPMVIFVRATAREEIWLRDQSYIYKFLALPGTNEEKKGLATAIPDYQIERLKFLLENAESEVTIVGNFKVDDYVRVSSGPLKGLEGIVSDANEKSSVVGIRIDGLGYACVSVEKNNLEIIQIS